MPIAWLPGGLMLAVAVLLLVWILRARRRPAHGPHHRSSWLPIFKQLLLAAPVRLWALILGGPALLGYAAWVTRIVWKGPWVVDHQGQQLDILGWALWGAIGLVAVVVISLAAVKVSAETKLGTFRVEGDDDRQT